ncbi:T-cell differentiation antigen CD6 [Erythrolamprus reginae]|uniref:T-cell differentiation antigen CD6 n=1 Tax=Erythrolamprus reginae TaxID=121349 RepID=UPI00396CA326
MDLVEVLVMALSLMAVRKVQAKPSKSPALRNTSSSTTTTTAKPEIQILRLMDGGSNCSGRVELKAMGIWGTACGDNWDLANAEVVCRQLGCGSASRSLNSLHFQNETGRIQMIEVKCLGNKLHLWDCLSKSSHGCEYKEIAGVICSGSVGIQTPTDTTERETVTSTSHLPSLISVPVLMNHRVQKLTTGGEVSLNLHKTEDVTPSAAHEDSDSDYEDYDFSKKPPVPLSNFYTSFHYQTTDDQVSPPHNFPKLTMRQETKCPKDYRQAEDSDSTSSGEADWYENIHKPQQHMEQQGDEPSFADFASGKDTETSNRMLQYDWHLDSFHLLIPNAILPDPTHKAWFSSLD